MRKLCSILFILSIQHAITFSQSSLINRQQFFLDDNPIEVALTTDIRRLRNDKQNTVFIPAHIIMQFRDSSLISEDISLQPRGNDRKHNCDIASLLLNFKNVSSPKLSPLKKLKLVGGCRSTKMYEELLLKEFLVYKIQNFLSPMSFRVRLLHVTYNDSRLKVKSYTQYAFLLEDINDLAKRNNCVELKRQDVTTFDTNRGEMTFVNLFQYMISNVDWSIIKRHNIKLLVPKNDTLANPYVVPYDFDFSGLVDAVYASTPEEFELHSVTERLYRGFPRSLDELETEINVFNEKKESIMYYINHFELCTPKCRKLMTDYLDEFYKIINNKKSVESIFITNARIQ
jgi:hypothetical protein